MNERLRQQEWLSGIKWLLCIFVLVQTVVMVVSWTQGSGSGEMETQGKEVSAAGSSL